MTIAPETDDDAPQIKIAPWDHSIEIDQKVTIKGDVEIRDSSDKAPLLSVDPNEQVITINGDIQSVNNINSCGTIRSNNLSTCSIATSTVVVSRNGLPPLVLPGLIAAEYFMADDSISLSSEKISSWADLSSHLIQRFTSPELPANCSQFYFEGCNLVTGTELPFIQVRETATGKLVQTPEMDVWVNLNKACTGYTLGKPVAEVEPCTSAIEAGKWTAIVMN